MTALASALSTARAAIAGAVRTGWFWVRLFAGTGTITDLKGWLAQVLRPLSMLGVLVSTAALFDDVVEVVEYFAFEVCGALTGWLGMHLGPAAVGVALCALIVMALASVVSLSWMATRRR